MLEYLLYPMIDFAKYVLELFPEADTESILAFAAPVGRLVCWCQQLDVGLPITEGLVGLGLYVLVFAGLYGVMLVRRVFSLFWPGAGS